MLASDPHLESRLPGFFHVSHIRGLEFDAIGAGVAGVPGVAVGHNGQLAWGVTAGMADTSDCYVERPLPADVENPDGAPRYESPAGPLEARTFDEHIVVRDGADVRVTALETRHGPVIDGEIGDDRWTALRSTALDGDDIVGPFLGLLRTRSTAEMEQVLEDWPGASFNWVYAHVDGEIGHRLAGRIPRRPPGVGLLPQDGATSEGPAEVLTASALPHASADAGVIVSANHTPGGDLPLGEEWCEPWRAERIAERLAERPRHDVDSFSAIQLDVRSEALARMRMLVVGVGAHQDHAQAADQNADQGDGLRGVLERWDGTLEVDSTPALAAELVFIELARTIVERLAGPAADLVLGSSRGVVSSSSSFHYRLQGWVLTMLEPSSPAWRDEADRAHVISAAIARAETALDALQPAGGLDAAPGWGTLHRLRFHHALHRVPIVGAELSIGDFAVGGDTNTVNQGGFTLQGGPGGAGGFSPAYRQVIDLADFDRSVFQLPAGNSGVPGSAHYADCVDDFLGGRYRPLLYTRGAVETAAVGRLRLEPG
jgi:penicillin amidase